MTTTITITRWGHACVALDRSGHRLVIDPGAFSDLSVLDAADAVLVTHEHTDHVDVDGLVRALERRPALEVWALEVVLDALAAAGAQRERLHPVLAGDDFAAAGFRVRAMGQWHAIVHVDVPRIHNLAFLVDGSVLHPGDSFTLPEPGTAVEVLLAPVSGPWLKVSEVVDHVRAVAPGVVVPIHDALLSGVGLALVDRLVGNLGGAAYCRLQTGEALTIG